MPALAQTYGFATLPPGTLNHTTRRAVAKVLKEKAGINMLVQPTAGDQVIVPMVSRGEVEIGITNILELANYYEGGKNPDLRVIGSVHALRTAFWVRKDAPMQAIGDLKGKRVASGYSAMRTIDLVSRAILATGGLTEKDIQPVMVPNVVRSADDFMSGAADMFFFAFGATEGARGRCHRRRHSRARDQRSRHGRRAQGHALWLSDDVAPGPIFTGVEQADESLRLRQHAVHHAKVPDELIYKFIETLENNKPDLIAVQPVLREFSRRRASTRNTTFPTTPAP